MKTKIVSFSVIYKSSTEEYVTKFFDGNGQERKQARYYTDDKQDAIDTGKATIERAKSI